MRRIVLINDIECTFDDSDVIPGNASPVTDNGKRQSDIIADSLSKRFPRFDTIVSSDAERLIHLLHQIRSKCKIKVPRIRYTESLRERNFGVITGTKFMLGFGSDIFKHSRICPEQGESVSQCSIRATKFIKGFMNRGTIGHILVVSHPFLCQIICNWICGRKQTFLTQFWFKKGAMMVADFTDVWKPKLFYQCIDEMEYQINEVYSEEMK